MQRFSIMELTYYKIFLFDNAQEDFELKMGKINLENSYLILSQATLLLLVFNWHLFQHHLLKITDSSPVGVCLWFLCGLWCHHAPWSIRTWWMINIGRNIMPVIHLSTALMKYRNNFSPSMHFHFSAHCCWMCLMKKVK